MTRARVILRLSLIEQTGHGVFVLFVCLPLRSTSCCYQIILINLQQTNLQNLLQCCIILALDFLRLPAAKPREPQEEYEESSPWPSWPRRRGSWRCWRRPRSHSPGCSRPWSWRPSPRLRSQSTRIHDLHDTQTQCTISLECSKVRGHHFSTQ